MFAMIKRVVATRRRRRVRRVTVDKLSALSDLTLKDIGIHRSQIWSVAEELLRETERSQVRPAVNINARATTADARTPFAYEHGHKAAA